MEIIPWKPFQREMEPFQREMDRFLNRVLGDTLPDSIGAGGWLPRLDIAETKENLVIEAELPGMDTKDIEVNLTGDVLTIKGEKKSERKENGKHYHCTERHIGSFQRAFRLPASVQGSKVDAGFDKGILTITLPKTEEAKDKEIKIKVH